VIVARRGRSTGNHYVVAIVLDGYARVFGGFGCVDGYMASRFN
jgi:hypothetical protein